MEHIKTDKLPRHIAIIMDGNGRWARENALKRVLGHKKGAQAVRTTVRTCRELGIDYLTLFAFSVENWSRPGDEVSALMALLDEYLKNELAEMLKNDIRLITIGRIGRLTETVRIRLEQTIAETAHCSGMVLNLALSYGGRDEIVDAARRIAADVKNGIIREDDIDKDRFRRYLFTRDMPDPDLLIRTSGEYRISNFLLWQIAYTELFFTPVLWPDFSREHLVEAIHSYGRRERRFGLTSEQVTGT